MSCERNYQGWSTLKHVNWMDQNITRGNAHHHATSPPQED